MQRQEEAQLEGLILKVREGGDSADAAFSELIQRYLPMIKKVTSGFVGGTVRDDEAFCEASVAFYKAVMSYSLERSAEVTFGLYARICVYRRLCDLVGKEKGKENLFSDLDVDSLVVNSGIEAALVSRERMSAALRKARSLLSEYEYEVFLLHLEGYETSDIAARLGREAKSIDNAKARLFKRLRDSRSGFSDIQ